MVTYVIKKYQVIGNMQSRAWSAQKLKSTYKKTVAVKAVLEFYLIQVLYHLRESFSWVCHPTNGVNQARYVLIMEGARSYFQFRHLLAAHDRLKNTLRTS